MKNDGNMLKLRPYIIASAILSVLSCNSVDDKWNSLDTDVLKASFEVFPDVDMTWPVEAQVKLSSSDFSFKYTGSFILNDQSGEWTADMPDTYYVLHPSGIDGIACDIGPGLDDYKVQFRSSIPSEQTAVYGDIPENFNICAGLCGKDNVVRFSNLFSLIKIDVQISAVASIVISGMNGEVMSGDFSVYADDSDGDGMFDRFYTKVRGGVKSITLFPPKGETVFPRGEYYVVTFPTEFKETVSVDFLDMSGKIIKENWILQPRETGRNRCFDAGSFHAPLIEESKLLFDSSIRAQYHASTIAETPEGDILIAAMGGKKEGAHDSCIWLVRHTKATGTWSIQEMLFQPSDHDDSETSWCSNPVLYQLPESAGGDMLLFYKISPDSRYGHSIGYLARSSDGGHTWKDDWSLSDMANVCGPCKNPPVMIGGRLISPAAGPQPDGTDWLEHYEISDDNGYTWKRINVLKTSLKGLQPTLIVHEDGTLQSLMRTTWGRVATSFSYDRGETWSSNTALPLKNNNTGICAITMKDGRFALVYDDNDTFYEGKTNGPRLPLKLALSDDGLEWKDIMTIEPDLGGNQEYSYPTMIQASDGSLLIVYTYTGRENGYKTRANIKFLRIKLL